MCHRAQQVKDKKGISKSDWPSPFYNMHTHMQHVYMYNWPWEASQHGWHKRDVHSTLVECIQWRNKDAGPVGIWLIEHTGSNGWQHIPILLQLCYIPRLIAICEDVFRIHIDTYPFVHIQHTIADLKACVEVTLQIPCQWWAIILGRSHQLKGERLESSHHHAHRHGLMAAVKVPQWPESHYQCCEEKGSYQK